jgi:hypothetical protein
LAEIISEKNPEQMQHLTDKQLETYFLSRQEMTKDELRFLETHTTACVSCCERFEQLRAFYSELETELHASPTEQEKELAEQIFSKQFSTQHLLEEPKTQVNVFQGYAEVIEPKHSFLFRLREFVFEHPVQFSGSMSFAFGLFAYLYFFVAPKQFDTNPTYARAKNEFLVAYNKDGQELWRKHIGIGYDLEKFLANNSSYDYNNFLVTTDIDNDGGNEVLANFGWMESSPLKNTILCFESNGNKKWKYEVHRNMVLGNETFADDYRIDLFIVKDFDKNGKTEIIAKALHNSYYACALFRLDANEGILLNEYWHSGHLQALKSMDLDNDGKEEILFGGANNGLNQAVIGVLNPNTMNGHSPATPPYIPQNQEWGTELYYILIPRTDIQSVAIQKRNTINQIKFYSNGIETIVMESLKDGDIPVHFHFDFQLNCTKVTDTDWFVVKHRQLEKEGKLTKKLNAEYWDELRQNVLFWNGKTFVKEATKNQFSRTDED